MFTRIIQFFKIKIIDIHPEKIYGISLTKNSGAAEAKFDNKTVLDCTIVLSAW